MTRVANTDGPEIDGLHKVLAAGVMLADFCAAQEATRFAGPRKYLHAGPPLRAHEALGPMRGALIAGLLYEGETDSVEEALVRVTDEPAIAIQAAKPWIAWAIQVGPHSAMRVIGIDEDVETRVVEAMNRGDRELAATYVTDEAVASFRVIGTPDSGTRQVEDIFSRGATMRAC